MEIDALEKEELKRQATEQPYCWFYNAFKIIKSMTTATENDIVFNVHLCGGLRSIIYYARWMAAGSKPGNKMIERIEEGISMETRVGTIRLENATIIKVIKDIETAVTATYATWRATNHCRIWDGVTIA